MRAYSRLVSALTAGLTALVLLGSLLGMNYGRAAAAGNTYYVNNSVACSDSNPGTSSSAPLCTISKAATLAGAGDTISVVAGTYTETVEPATGGSSGSPITYTAGAGVVITGTVGTTSAFRFTNPSYITVNGFHINATTETGIYITGNSGHIILSGNTITNTTSFGIQAVGTVATPVSNLTISNNAISNSGGSGIYLKNVTSSTVSGNTSHNNSGASGNVDGIRLNASTGVTVSNNTVYANQSSKANGIALITASNNNTVSHNIVYSNDDSGLQLTSSTGNVFVGNLSYRNGDHGLDVSTNSTGTVVTGNTIHGNYAAGLNVEISSGAAIQNNILADNGWSPTSPANPYDLLVDSTSYTATTVDYNLYYLTSPHTDLIDWNSSPYTSLADFKTATSQEQHGLQADPKFNSPATPVTSLPPSVTTGNYHLLSGSPAIDSANSAAANEPTTDLDGNGRYDDTGTANTGAGTRLFDDRGAYEYQSTPTTTAVNCGAGTPVTTYGTDIGCVATVTASSGTTSPTGTVSWTTGGNGSFVSGSSCTLSGSGGSATCSKTYHVTAVGTGSHLITATYAGAGTFSGSTGNQTVTVNKKNLTVTGITASNKTYDATTNATINTTSAALVGVVSGDTVSLVKTGASGAFTPDGNVGTGKTVQIAGLTITGSSNLNYNLVQPTTTANITAKALTVTGITADNKVYDATTAAAINTAGAALVGNLDGGNVVLNTAGAGGAFTSKTIGAGKTVNITGLTLTGSAIGNYTLTQPTTTADITAKSVTVTGVLANNKTYDGTAAATLNMSGASISGGVIAGDTVTLPGAAAGNFDNKNVGTGKSVNPAVITLGGADGGNYVVTPPAGLTANISVANLTVTATADNKVYDGTTAAVAHIVPGQFGSDVVTGSYTGAAFASKDVANGISVAVSGISLGGADAGNYHLVNTTATATANITSAPLDITANDRSKHSGATLDLGTTAFTTSPSPLFNGDSVTGVTLTSDGAAAGASDGPHDIFPSAAVGTGLGNYTITYHKGTLTVSSVDGSPSITEGASVNVPMSINANPTAFSLTLHATDPELDTLTWSLSAPSPAHGAASLPASHTGNAMAIHYNPALNYRGSESFGVTVNDGFGGTAVITVNVSLNPNSVTFRSVGTQDGWVLESGENTSTGGKMDSAAASFFLGDDALNKQYRGILSFNTASLDDKATITGMTVQVKASGSPVGANPFTTLGNILVDAKNGNFGAAKLELADFQSAATKSAVLTIKNNPLAGGWYFGTLNSSAASTLVSKTANTQLRLRFTKDDDNNKVANYLRLFSGNSTTSANRPILIVYFYLPPK